MFQLLGYILTPPIAAFILIGIGIFMLKYAKKFTKTEIARAKVTAKNLGDIPVLGKVFEVNKNIAQEAAPIYYKLFPYVLITSGILILFIWLSD